MIYIESNSKTTIHEQLVQKISNLIITGAMKPDEKLPSVRSLASQLIVNPHTVNKAYSELEEKGFITCIKNKGYYVSHIEDDIKNEELSKTFKVFDEVTLTLLKLGISTTELCARTKRLEVIND